MKRHQRGWIEGPFFDLVFISGAVLGHFLYLFVLTVTGVSSVFAYFAYSALLDAPHSVATHLRVFESRQSREAHLRTWRWSFLLYLVGPASVAIGLTWSTGLPFKLFHFSVFAWASYHLVRQHYGLYCLYQTRGGLRSARIKKVGASLFQAVFILNAIYYLLVGPIDERMFGQDLLPKEVLGALLWVIAVGVCVLFSCELLELVRSKGKSLPKLIFVMCLASFYGFLYFSGQIYDLDVFSVMPLATIQHNIQYLAFVRLHQKKVLSTTVSKPMVAVKAWQFLAVVLSLGFLIRGVEWSTTSVASFFPKIYVDFPLGQGMTFYGLMLTFLLGYSLQHYFLDQYLWRLSRDSTYQRSFLGRNKCL